MSYNDDEELKIGDFEEEEDDVDLDNLSLDDTLLDDEFAEPLDEDDDEPLDEIAGLDGSEY